MDDDATVYTITLQEFRLFHTIDRALYGILVKDLGRDHTESIYTMALWLWLERREFCQLIIKILALPPFLINELADEAIVCLKCVNPSFPCASESYEIPLTQGLVKKEISLQYFFQNLSIALPQIQSIATGVCIPALSDVSESIGRGRSQIGVRRTEGESSKSERTMFVTFSKGYPVSESEVRSFFTRMLGNCIESFHMQEVGGEEQALYAKIVFIRPSFISAILNGARKAKFTINGKHVWMRKFVPKNVSSLP